MPREFVSEEYEIPSGGKIVNLMIVLIPWRLKRFILNHFHSIVVYKGRQDSHLISIGDYCFVSTGVKVLGGVKLPDHSVLAAGAVLNKPQYEPFSLYGGVPAKSIKYIPKNANYMNRLNGFVN